MSDEIRNLTQRLANEPTSIAFLELGEALRRRGQLEAAGKVVRGGLSRYPGLADAHDLMGRILSDQGDLAGAFDAWADALRFDPMRTGALKGIAFLYFRAGDVAAALEHLQRAAEADPDDPVIPQAIARVRREAGEAGRAGFAPAADPGPQAETAPAAEAEPITEPETAAPPAPPSVAEESPFAAVEEDERGLLLVDTSGQRLGGRLTGVNGEDAGDRVAAHLAGVTREAARATRLLGLGSWHSIAIESPDAHLFLSTPTAETVLLALREPSLPMARLALVAERAGRAARGWLERMR
ncbi:MAG TPA: tetratricopeptide repeat protein [Gemmatimonadales bacterium]|nr:tetratricopeptide repeat protein [Gemmatimonadales bacterium]